MITTTGPLLESVSINDAARAMVTALGRFGGEVLVVCDRHRMATAYPPHIPMAERAIARDPSSFVGLYQSCAQRVSRGGAELAEQIAEDIWCHLVESQRSPA